MRRDVPESESLGELAGWLKAARGGSTEALGHLLEMCRQYLLGVANRELESQLKAKAAASDVVQDTFAEAQRIFDRFEGGSQEELLAWLRAILLNKLSDVMRRYRDTEKRRVARELPLDASGAGRALRGGLHAPDTSPSGQAMQQEQQEAVSQALDRLPEHYRQVIVWREWEQLPFEEIGRRLDRTAGAARTLWWRAITRLQSEMNERT